MRAVTFQAPGEVRVEERPEPELAAPDDAVVRVEATGICGSDLHIYHGRVAIEPGFVIGHEYVGTVVAAGDGVSEVAVGDRVLGTYSHRLRRRAFTAGAASTTSATRAGSSGTARRSARFRARRPSWCSCPKANLTLRRVPEGLSDEVALFAGDVRGPATTRCAAMLRGPSRSSPARRSRCSASGRSASAPCRWRGRRARRWWSRSTRSRSGCGWPSRFGAVAGPPHRGRLRGRVKELTEGRGVRPGGRRGRPSRGARPGVPAGPQGGHRLGRPASTPSAPRSTWASSGSRR